MDVVEIPGSAGSVGPFPDQYTEPHVYARDVTSGAGNCVCGAGLGDDVHVEAAPGVEIPDRHRLQATRFLGKGAAVEQRYVLGVAYQAGPDQRIKRGADGGRDFFSAAELEKAAWGYLSGGPQVGLFHGPDDTIGHATVVESYVYRGPDWDHGDGVVVKSGDWLIGAVLDDAAWGLVKSGHVTGWSPQGTARRRAAYPPSASAAARSEAA